MKDIQWIHGGVCAPLGFTAAGIHCGVRKNRPDKKDLALIVSETLADAAAVYTTNVVQAAPIAVTKNNLKNGKAKAVLCNSGIANACVADGVQKANAMCALVADALNCDANDIIVASTGVIGQSINLHPIQKGVPTLVASLSPHGNVDAATAMMTTDTFSKEVAVSFLVDGKEVRIGGAAKGSGMINPNMATMLGFITTDAKVDSTVLYGMLKRATGVSFNRVSVDGDTSTNDMLAVMANGKSGIEIVQGTKSAEVFESALTCVCVALAKMLAKDGEGATKLLECAVSGAMQEKTAAQIAESIINSSLVKTAMFGADANWGRILCAAGYSGADFNPEKVDIYLQSKAGDIQVCGNGAGLDFNEELAKQILTANEIVIKVNLNQGDAHATFWGCDLSYDYVKINGDYRT